ncbi:MAG TPA: hydrogenase, partial [Verrucomicrobiae bacterium]|nr:hydrogenase [Verrucomicrobiae bacterium]
MLAPLLILLPLTGALLAWLIPSDRVRPLLLPLFAVPHAALSVFALSSRGATEGKWLALDAVGGVILGGVSLLFLCCSLYAVGYLRFRAERPNRVLCMCLLVCLAAMT